MNAARPIVQIGLNWYPDGIHIVPHTLGIRMPYPTAAIGSPEQTYNAGFEHGARESSWRVGTAGLVVGAGLGVLALMLWGRREKRATGIRQPAR